MRIAWMPGQVNSGTLLSFNYAEQIFGFLLEPATEALAARAASSGDRTAEIFFTYVECRSSRASY
ncbi:MAG: hypothetical protein R3E53_12370 [Myxococcota bacterium]